MPFVHQYQINGQGRDTYISLDNGGNYAMHHADMQVQPGAIYRGGSIGKSAIHYQRALPAKNVVYNHDGTGRDSYISSTNGGFYPSMPTAAY